jgi:hypothetical protein
MTDEAETQEATGEQILYARVLEAGMFMGLLILFVTFAIYVSGLMSPAVPLDRVPSYWHQGVHEYLEAVNHEYLHLEHPVTGWAWVSWVGKADFLNFVGIAVLAGVTVLCYLAILPTLWRKKDIAYFVMSVLEASVLALAASGILTAGH